MNVKKYHKYLGFILLLPFITWAVTGVFFFFKPGYSQAYEKLLIETYPINTSISSVKNNHWSEIRVIRSILGYHLLVKDLKKAWHQLDLNTLQPTFLPSEQQITILVEDAIKHNPERYGDILRINNTEIVTSTNVTISLNWQTMSLKQKGADTEFIQLMYKLHYLQWTGIPLMDKVLGVIGLLLVLILAFLGMFLSFKPLNKHINNR